MVSLYLVVAEAKAHMQPFSPFFIRCEKAFRGCQLPRECLFSFCIMRLLSLPRVARVKSGAESALERFEELQKEVKKSLFVGRALFSLVD